MAALAPRALCVVLLGLASCAHAPARGSAPLRPGAIEIVCAAGPAATFATGSFNGWQAPGEPMQAQLDGRFAVALRLEAGVHRVACNARSASGAFTLAPPVNAPRVEDDGFGGVNGVWEISSD